MIARTISPAAVFHKPSQDLWIAAGKSLGWDLSAWGANYDMTYLDVMRLACARAISEREMARKVRLFAADCAARVVLLADSESQPTLRETVNAARAFARGRIDAAAMAAAREPAREIAARAAEKAGAMWAVDRSTLPANINWSAALAASHATNHGYPWHWVRDATRNAATAMAISTAAASHGYPWVGGCTRVDEWNAAWEAANMAEEDWQFRRLLSVISYEPTDWPLPST